MPTVNDLRAGLTEQQRAMLSAIWRYYMEKGKWIPRRVLHVQSGGKAAVRTALDAVGGSVAYESRDNAQEVYRLTFLGVLLSDHGLEIQRLLIRYLEWARDLAQRDPEITHIEGVAAQAALNLSTEETLTLGVLISLGALWSGSAGYGSTEWRAGLPHDVEDIQDAHAYFEREALKHYAPKMPFEEGPRQTYDLRAGASTPWREAAAGDEDRDISFPPPDILHPRLREQVYDVLMRGDCETAVFQAFREVEIAVREATGLAPEDVGVPLMREAFHKTHGPLTDVALPEGERDAMSHLFAGAIGLFKNPQSHRHAPITDPAEAIELVLLASHLLRIVTKRKDASGMPPTG